MKKILTLRSVVRKVQRFQFAENGEEKRQGNKKNFFECRKIEGFPIVNIQTDNKILVEGGNSSQMDKKTEISGYNKKRERRRLSRYRSVILRSTLNMGCSTKLQLSEREQEEINRKQNRWRKTVFHKAMFGVLPTNVYLNMKLPEPNDKRTFRKFKKSVCRCSIIQTRALFLRESGRQRQQKSNH